MTNVLHTWRRMAEVGLLTYGEWKGSTAVPWVHSPGRARPRDVLWSLKERDWVDLDPDITGPGWPWTCAITMGLPDDFRLAWWTWDVQGLQSHQYQHSSSGDSNRLLIKAVPDDRTSQYLCYMCSLRRDGKWVPVPRGAERFQNLIQRGLNPNAPSWETANALR